MVIITSNVETRNFTVLLTSDTGYVLYLQTYSKDFSKIAFIEHSDSNEYLSIFENRQKKRIVQNTKSNPPINFSSTPMEFSPDGKYIAFSEKIWHAGQ